ncbi:unnamed protein product [Pseudo-nitzschia multistriata]|uniref:Uncharacterized protein n=1 Tax=Pseudo-nitzschia multistriata TaxID=183589 RepID=A0A448ZAR9_9STRA|nr:unnamed protein product [Pseudo-nitzschia multistriata]
MGNPHITLVSIGRSRSSLVSIVATAVCCYDATSCAGKHTEAHSRKSVPVCWTKHLETVAPHGFNLVTLQIEIDGLDSFFRDDLDLDLVARVNVALPTREECILDDFHYLFLGKFPLFVLTISVCDYVIEERNDVGLATARRRDRRSLEASDGIVGINSPLSLFVDATKDIEGVVWEEPLVVQGVSEHLGHRGSRHRLSVVVVVHFHLDVEDGPQLIDVCFASGTTKHALLGEGMELAHVARENFVTGTQTGVGRNHCIVGTRNGHAGTPIKVVGTEATLVGVFGDAVVDFSEGRVSLRVVRHDSIEPGIQGRGLLGCPEPAPAGAHGQATNNTWDAKRALDFWDLDTPLILFLTKELQRSTVDAAASSGFLARNRKSCGPGSSIGGSIAKRHSRFDSGCTAEILVPSRGPDCPTDAVRHENGTWGCQADRGALLQRFEVLFLRLQKIAPTSSLGVNQVAKVLPASNSTTTGTAEDDKRCYKPKPKTKIGAPNPILEGLSQSSDAMHMQYFGLYEEIPISLETKQ